MRRSDLELELAVALRGLMDSWHLKLRYIYINRPCYCKFSIVGHTSTSTEYPSPKAANSVFCAAQSATTAGGAFIILAGLAYPMQCHRGMIAIVPLIPDRPHTQHCRGPTPQYLDGAESIGAADPAHISHAPNSTHLFELTMNCSNLRAVGYGEDEG